MSVNRQIDACAGLDEQGRIPLLIVTGSADAGQNLAEGDDTVNSAERQLRSGQKSAVAAELSHDAKPISIVPFH